MFQPFDLFPKFRIAFAFLLLCLGVQTTLADGLPKAEDGYAYYCSGERINSYYKSPNAIIILKLRKEDVRRDKKAMLYCETDSVDERFILESFFLPGENRIEGAVNFKVRVVVAGQNYDLEMMTGAGPMANYQQQGKLDRFKTKSKVCGISSQANELGLFLAKVDKQKAACRRIPFVAFGFINSEAEPINIDCWSDGKCLYSFFYKDWAFDVRLMPRSLVPHWRDLHKQFIEAIENRIVFYLAPNGCFGPFNCDDFSQLVHTDKRR